MSSTRNDKLAGRFFLCMIGLMLLLMGGVFEWLMIRSFLHAKASRDWPQVEAVVLQSDRDERQVMGSPPEYRYSILFGYTYEGEALTSKSLSPRGSKWTRDESSVTQLVADYQTGSTHTAWVNPDEEDKAILKHDTKAAGYTFWFPALIIVGGAGMIWGAFAKGAKK